MIVAYIAVAVLSGAAAYVKFGGPLWKTGLLYGLLWPVWLLVFVAGGLNVMRRNRERNR